MHSSRMRTARLLTASRSMGEEGRGACMAGGHAWQGGICGRGVCVAGGVRGRGHAWWGGGAW